MNKIKEFTKEDISKVEELAKTKTFEEIAQEFGMSLRQFKHLKSKQPELRDAAERGSSKRTAHPNSSKLKKPDREFTSEELENIESLASKHTYIEISQKLGISENNFLSLRQKNEAVKEAITRGIAKRDKDFKKKRMSKRMKEAKKIHEPNIKITYDDEIAALKRFREKFEADKQKRDIKELKEIDLI